MGDVFDPGTCPVAQAIFEATGQNLIRVAGTFTYVGMRRYVFPQYVTDQIVMHDTCRGMTPFEFELGEGTIREDNMQIYVDDKHIKAGLQKDCCSCPVALAIREKTGLSVMVTSRTIRVGGIDYPVPVSVVDFIHCFDENMRVEAFDFELRCY